MKYIKITKDNITMIYPFSNQDSIIYEKGFVYPVHKYDNDFYNNEKDIDESKLESDKIIFMRGNDNAEIILAEGYKCNDLFDIIMTWLSVGLFLGKKTDLLDVDDF